MDLRKQLLHTLGALLTVLMVVATAIHLHSLRQDVATEIDASARLARALFVAARINPALPVEEAAAQLRAITNDGALRHLTISLGGVDTPQPHIGPFARLFGADTTGYASESLRIGNLELRITPNPASEIDERFGDIVRLLITLLLFSGATLLVAWWSAHRALSPVRELEAGLERLARGEPAAGLPAFRLREFDRIAGAIETLAAALRESRAAQRTLSRRLISVQEDERRTLARELHDEMGQTLTAINATAAHLERRAGMVAATEIIECAGELRRDIRTCGRQLRGILKSLRPHGLDAGSLGGTLRELVNGWRARATGIAFHLELPTPLPQLDDEVALTLYRVVQEGLTNVVRHSGARCCDLRLTTNGSTIRVEIEDDGCGLLSGSAAGGGLGGMAERLGMVGGRLEFTPGTNGGLRLTATLPIRNEEETEG
ncbi:MAG: histidine kinase [Azospira sp.]|nr:histidine kinase [Azospira sp.]